MCSVSTEWSLSSWIFYRILGLPSNETLLIFKRSLDICPSTNSDLVFVSKNPLLLEGKNYKLTLKTLTGHVKVHNTMCPTASLTSFPVFPQGWSRTSDPCTRNLPRSLLYPPVLYANEFYWTHTKITHEGCYKFLSVDTLLRKFNHLSSLFGTFRSWEVEVLVKSTR